MKRISIFLVLVIFITACMPLSITGSSASDTITKSEAQELVGKACDFHSDVHTCSQFDKNPICNIFEYKEEYLYDEDSGEFVGKKVLFPVYEENLPGGSYEGMCKYAETLYTEDIAYSSYMFFADGTKLGYVSYESYRQKDGGLYCQDINGDWFLNTPADYSAAYLNDEYYENKDYTKISIDIISGDSQSAIAKVDVHNAWGWSDTVICKFVHTPKGWRIAESEYSILLAIGRHGMEEYRTAASPSTSDPAFNLIFILPTVSVAALASAVCLMRRRRESVF